MITIKFKKDYRTFKAGDEFTFEKNIPNIVMGENASGKSTLLMLIRSYFLKNNLLKTKNNYLKHSDDSFEDVVELSGLDRFDNFYDFNTETDTGKTNDMSTMLEFDGLATSRASSAQGQLHHFNKLIMNLKDSKNNLVLLDEIDKGFSLKNQENFYDSLKGICERFDTTIIVVSHSIFLLDYDILNLNSKKIEKGLMFYMPLDKIKAYLLRILFEYIDNEYIKEQYKKLLVVNILKSELADILMRICEKNIVSDKHYKFLLMLLKKLIS